MTFMAFSQNGIKNFDGSNYFKIKPIMIKYLVKGTFLDEEKKEFQIETKSFESNKPNFNTLLR